MAIITVPVQTERRTEAGPVFPGEDAVAHALHLEDFPSGTGEISGKPLLPL